MEGGGSVAYVTMAEGWALWDRPRGSAPPWSALVYLWLGQAWLQAWGFGEMGARGALGV